MASAMGSLFISLWALLSASAFVDCQMCDVSYCSPSAGYSATCQNSRCLFCINSVSGSSVSGSYSYVNIHDIDGNCRLACNGPSLADDTFCSSFGKQACFAITSIRVKLSDGSFVTRGGVCDNCREGYVVNAARDGCTLALSPPPPARTPPSASPPPTDTLPGTPPKNSEGSSPPPTAPSSSNEQKKKNAFPSYLKYVLSITIPAAAAGIIGLFFFCCQNRMHLAAERKKSPLARAVRSQLKLKGVDDFKAVLGLQYCTSIEMLAEKLRTSGYIKAPALLGHDMRYLAAAIAAALRQRYEPDITNNQKGFLARFAHDCNDEASLGSLIFDVEEKIRANEGWSRRLALPPKGSSANFVAAPTPPPASAILTGIPPPHVTTPIPHPHMMPPPPPPPQNPQRWTPSAPPSHHYPPPTAP